MQPQLEDYQNVVRVDAHVVLVMRENVVNSRHILVDEDVRPDELSTEVATENQMVFVIKVRDLPRFHSIEHSDWVRPMHLKELSVVSIKRAVIIKRGQHEVF